MVTSISLSEQDSVQKGLEGPHLGSQGYPMKVTLGKGNKSCWPLNLRCSAAAIMAWEFSLNARLKAVDATDLGSKGIYGIVALFRKKYAKFSQKACS